MRASLLFPLLLLAGTVVAGNEGGKPLAIAAITSQQQQIRAEVQAGKGRYKDMPSATREQLLSRQADLLAMLEGKVSTNDLTSTERIEAFNTLEWIEASINNAEADRMVCTREKRLGSNRMDRVCKTMAQIEAEREYARMNINSGCAAGVCGE